MGANEAGYFVGVIFGALIMGAIIGLIPLILGINKGQKQLGIIGLVSCIVGSLILGLFLSIPIAIVFTIIILTKSNSPS
tara:strand:+ start:6955 stop:7191 length:237 start_codon:yes stop_codon:yes gene_type:complete